MIQTTLIDNSEQLKLVDTLNEIIALSDVNEICIATGYWDLKGTALIADALKTFLRKEGAKLRLLIGKDPSVCQRDLTAEAYRNAKKYPQDFIKIDLQNVQLNVPSYQEAAKLLIDYCSAENPKIEVHVFNINENDERQFFHAKCYIFTDGTDDNSFGIIGSSNFTEKGLQGNSELNYLESNGMIVNHRSEGTKKGHIQWFNEKWELSDDWTKEFVVELANSPVGKIVSQKKDTVADTPHLTPYENYIRLLQDRFGMVTDCAFRSVLEGYLPPDITPLDYQLSAVQQCWSNMLRHGGFALGDVVGLGKTIVGVLIAKYHIENATSLGKSRKVLIVVPPAVKSAWEETIRKFDKDRNDKIEGNITLLTTGRLGTLSASGTYEESEFGLDATEGDMGDAQEFDFGIDAASGGDYYNGGSAEFTGISNQFSQGAEDCGLVIIDESHKFRNNGTEMYAVLSEYLEAVNSRAGYYPFVGLLSATIQNNSPRDIRNQIYLFEHEPKSSSFEKVAGHDLEHFFAEVDRKYAALIHADKNQHDELIALSKEVREKVLADILVRRTRTDIKMHYAGDLKFPAVHGPENLCYTMDRKLSQLFSDTMNMIAPKSNNGGDEGLGYYRYRATMFLDGRYAKVYSGRNMTASRSSAQLARIMQMLLVKRLESSFEAFKESLRNFRRYTQNMIAMWESDTIFICPQIDVNKELDIKEKQAKNPGKIVTLETCFNDIRTKIAKLNGEGRNDKGQNAEYSRKDFIVSTNGNTYIDCLKSDLEKIDSLVERWNENDYDPKFDRFKTALRETSGLFCKERNKPHKLVIFSEAISTVNSLGRAVENITGKAPLVITASNRDEMEDVIKENFDANCVKEKQKDDYDVIITTEVLAEGINLHRANTILNYDTPWNATRLIQRIGRVNRIGSPNTDIYVYNFYPSPQGDEQIKLVRNALTKLQSFHIMFGEDARIFSPDEELAEGNFEAFVDGEESPQEKYISELRAFRESNRARYDFIQSLETGDENALAPMTADTAGNAYFAVKTKGKRGSVYIKADSASQCNIIDYTEMFEACRCAPSAKGKPIPPMDERDKKRAAAFAAFNEYSNRQSRAKNAGKNTTDVLEKATGIINSGALDRESMRLLGNAVKSVRNGNTTLAKRLGALLGRVASAEGQLIPITPEELSAIIKRELSNAASGGKKTGEAYIFAGVYR